MWGRVEFWCDLMGRWRKNFEYEKLFLNVYLNKYSYVWKLIFREFVILIVIKDGLVVLWKKYEEIVNNCDCVMIFGCLWEKFFVSVYYSDFSLRI